MTSRPRAVLLLTALLLIPASLALATGAPSTPATPPALAAAVAQPLPLDGALSTAAPLCPRADLPSFPTTTARPLANGICGGCSDAACLDKEEFSVCGDGFRCLTSPACSPQPELTCQCKIIG